MEAKKSLVMEASPPQKPLPLMPPPPPFYSTQTLTTGYAIQAPQVSNISEEVLSDSSATLKNGINNPSLASLIPVSTAAKAPTASTTPTRATTPILRHSPQRQCVFKCNLNRIWDPSLHPHIYSPVVYRNQNGDAFCGHGTPVSVPYQYNSPVWQQQPYYQHPSNYHGNVYNSYHAPVTYNQHFHLAPHLQTPPDLAHEQVFVGMQHSYWAGRYSALMDKFSELNPYFVDSDEPKKAIATILEACCKGTDAVKSYKGFVKAMAEAEKKLKATEKEAEKSVDGTAAGGKTAAAEKLELVEKVKAVKKTEAEKLV